MTERQLTERQMIENLRGRTPRYIGEDARRRYAVMIPLIEQDGQMQVLFEVRAAAIGRQPGEICFPGGGRKGSESSKETAVRETCEELLIAPEQIEVICEMDTLLNQRHEEVHVYLGKLSCYKGTFSKGEVEEVFCVPLDYFLEQPPRMYACKTVYEFPEDFPFDKLPGGRDYPWRLADRQVCFYFWNERVIWGMTARVMRSAAEILKRG